MNGQTSLQGWTIIPTPQTMQHKADIALLPMCGRINEARAVGDDRHILAVQLIDDIRAATGLEWDIATGDRWPGFITLTTFDDPHAHPSGAYTLDVTPDGVTVAGADFEGVRNGVQTYVNSSANAAPPCPACTSRTDPPSKRAATTSTPPAGASPPSTGSNTGPTSSACTNTTSSSSTSNTPSRSTR